MTIATRLKWYLDSHGVDYEVVHHARSNSSLESARAAHVPGGRLAKCVLLEDTRGYVLAVLPASCRIEMKELRWELGRNLALASEAELAGLFSDCELGALPALGDAYGIPTVVDDSLLRLPDLYLEAGDHEDLVHVSGSAFRELLRGSAHARFGRPN
jgi:Ala-tRNA(Pro) deacylase